MKKIMVIVLCLALAVALVACSSTPAEPATEESTTAPSAEATTSADASGVSNDSDKHYKFGFTEWGAGDFFDAVYAPIEEAVTANGDTIIHLEGQADSNAQLQIVEDFISQGVDLVFFNPVDSEACRPAVEALVEAGIPVVNFDSAVVNIEQVDTFIATDNFKAGQLAAEALKKDFPDGGKVAVLDLPVNTAATDRADGFLDGIKDSNFEVVAQLDAGGKPEKGLEITNDILQANDDLVAIFAINDESGMGAYAAVVAAGEDVAIYGVNGGPEAKAEISKNTVYRATAAQSPINIGKASVEAAYKILNGENVEKEIYIEPFIIDRDNVKDYLAESWQ